MSDGQFLPLHETEKGDDSASLVNGALLLPSVLLLVLVSTPSYDDNYSSVIHIHAIYVFYAVCSLLILQLKQIHILRLHSLVTLPVLQLLDLEVKCFQLAHCMMRHQ